MSVAAFLEEWAAHFEHRAVPATPEEAAEAIVSFADKRATAARGYALEPAELAALATMFSDLAAAIAEAAEVRAGARRRRCDA